MKKKGCRDYLPALVRRGRQEEANYDTDQEVSFYRGIPTAEALGPILAKTEVVARLAAEPPYTEQDRLARPEARLHCVQAAMLNWFQPLANHIDLQQRLDRVIRGSLPYRNPLIPGYYREVSQQVDRLADLTRRPSQAPYQRTTALGFHFTAPSGSGKTTSLERLLIELYAQRIIHSSYKGKPFRFDQLVWLHLDCPGDGSLRQLLIQFLHAVDSIIGKTRVRDDEYIGYYDLYGGTRATVDSLISAVATVAANHCLSVLIIDEIQHLLHADGDGADRVLNYLVTLVNTIGVPVILVGTPRANHVLSRQGKQIRRGTGQGELEWCRLDRDSNSYTLMTESMWQYQYTDEHICLNEQLKDVLFEETQGIPDYMIKAYMMAQWRSITTGKRISGGMIRSVVKDGFSSARPLLRALRLKQFDSLKNLDDLHPPDLNPVLQACEEALRQSQAEKVAPVQESKTDDNPKSPQTGQMPQTPGEHSSSPDGPSPDNTASHYPIDLNIPTLKQLQAKAQESGQDLYEAMHAEGLVYRQIDAEATGVN